DRLAVMYAGEMIEEGSAAAVAQRSRHPYTHALLGAVPSVRRPRYVVGIPGRPPTSVVLDSCAYAPRCAYVLAACRTDHVSMHDPGDGHVARCIRLEEIEKEPLPGHELSAAP